MKITRWRRGELPLRVKDECAAEEPLAIEVDGKTIHITMRTPGNDEELALGFLFSETLIRRPKDIASLEQPSPNRIQITLAAGVTIDFSKLARHVMGSSSCGLCGKTSIERVRLPFEAISSDGAVTAETLLALPDRLREAQATFARTGGLHAAGVFTLDGELLVAREDIGRHNAVDKVVGQAFRAGSLPLRHRILMVSGRTSFEILQKAVAGGFPIVAAVSAPSTLAVEFAQRAGQTLVGFLRGDRLNVYAGGERVHF